MSKQVMQRALDALEDRMGNLAKADAAIAELRAAIAAPEVEPVAWTVTEMDSVITNDDKQTNAIQFSQRYLDMHDIPLYATPPDTEAMRKELERIGLQNAKLYDDFNKSQLELERVKGERDAMAIDSECFNLWVHEAWNNPSDICRLLSGCETPDDYRAKLVPIIEARKATFSAIAAQRRMNERQSSI